MYMAAKFLNGYMDPSLCYWDLLLPINIYHVITGQIELFWLMALVTGYGAIWFWFTSTAFLMDQCQRITRNNTSFEDEHKIKIVSTNSVLDNLRGVFGENWVLNFLVPLHWKFPQKDDGVTWEGIKVE